MWESSSAWLADAYDRDGTASYSLAVRILGKGEHAESAVVEAFEELQRVQRTAPRVDARAHILLITRNAAVARLRRLKGLPEPQLTPRHPQTAGGPAPEPLSVETLRQVSEALAGLASTSRLVLQRAFFDGQTISEIASDLGLTETHVTHALRSAIGALSTVVTPDDRALALDGNERSVELSKVSSPGAG